MKNELMKLGLNKLSNEQALRIKGGDNGSSGATEDDKRRARPGGGNPQPGN